MTALTPAPARRLQSIDVLRGIAILLVIALHLPHYAQGGWRLNPWFFPGFFAGFGYLGVPLFIVISGFCIHRTAAATCASSGTYSFGWVQFWKRRFIRLYPPYLAAIVFSVVSAFWLHSRIANPSGFFGWDLGTHLLLVHDLTYEYATTLGNGPFWSLGAEEQLYALYFLLLLLWARVGHARTLWLVAAVSVCWRIAWPLMPDPGLDLGVFHLGAWARWPLNYWLHWTLGAYAVDAYLGNRKLPAWTASPAWAIVLLAAGVLANTRTFEFVLHGRLAFLEAHAVPLAIASNLGELVLLLGFFCLMNFLLARERRGGVRGRAVDALAWVGRISYSLYLTHFPLIWILQERLPIPESGISWPLRILVYGTIVMVFGWLFHQGVERWFLHGRLPWSSRRMVPAAESAS